MRSHRLAWELTFGAIPKGLLVCHHCDNPSCCNPGHLFLGTNKDNTQDKINKGRSNHLLGEKHQNSKLTTDEVIQIRKLYTTGKFTQVSLASQFNTCLQNISDIVNHKRWKWLD